MSVRRPHRDFVLGVGQGPRVQRPRPAPALVDALEPRCLLASLSTLLNSLPGAATALRSAVTTATNLSASGAPVTAAKNESFSGAVANFEGPFPFTSNYTATIDWGDNTATSTGTVSSNGTNGFQVIGKHTYTQTGNYTTTVTITGSTAVGGPSQTTVVFGQASVTVPPTYQPAGLTIKPTAGQPFTGTVASFTDSNTSEQASAFTATIDWGSGQNSTGQVTGSNGSFLVSGTNTYPNSGTFPITVTVTAPDGETFTANSTATVASAPTVAFAGALAPEVVNGPNSSLGQANTNRPVFSGTAPAFATVQLFAEPWGVDANQPLGTAIASGSGSWSLSVGPLANGVYNVTAVVTPPGGYPSSNLPLANNGLVVINTVSTSTRPTSFGVRPHGPFPGPLIGFGGVGHPFPLRASHGPGNLPSASPLVRRFPHLGAVTLTSSGGFPSHRWVP